ncbi:MAG TPA: glycosyltransferase [Cyclobacteriaceae bacterium]|nr:glycosyltransferase [Cyclobacteriaceae bacterium]
MKGVSIIIPVYGQWHLVKLNIERNFQYDEGHIHEVIIVDDCSPEPNPYLFPDPVRIIKNAKNLGYTGTVNAGLKAATSEIVVLLDSDAYPVGPYMTRLIGIYEDAGIGCVGFKTVDESGNNTGNFDYEPSMAGLIAGQMLYARLQHLDIFSSKRILPYSCAVSFRKKCLEELAYFDEKNFPVLDADHDLSMRIHRSKWKLVFIPEIVICHKGGNSIPRNHKRVLTFHRGRWRLLKKFGLIKSPWLAKRLLRARVRAEILVLEVQSRLKDRSRYEDKLKGRKILLQEIKDY